MINKAGWTEEDHINYADYLRDMQEEERIEDMNQQREYFSEDYWCVYDNQKGW